MSKNDSMLYADVTSVAGAIRGDSIDEAIAHLRRYSKGQLIAIIVNEYVNSFISHRDSADKGDEKRIPYMGWWWRYTDFANKRIPVGFSGDYTGVMENNKWDYAQRDMTEAEVDEFTALIWAAMKARGKGGVLSELEAATDEALDRAGAFIAGLPRAGAE